MAAYLSLLSTLIILVIPGSVIDWLALWAYQWWPWPSSGLASGSISIDKFIHAVLFAVCGALIVKGWMEQIGRWQWVFLSLMGYAMFTEFLQLLVPGRGASVGDLLADCIGAGIGMFWAFRFFRPTSE